MCYIQFRQNREQFSLIREMHINKLIVFCAICVFINAQDVDWSFREMCKFYRGEEHYKRRSNGFQSTRGDICRFHFPIVFNQSEPLDIARKYCEDNVPYHINGLEIIGDHTVCIAEATLICASGWVQMFGKCYKIEKKLMTRGEAKNHCAGRSHKSRIAFMHREALPFRIYDYFSSVSRVWIDASEAITNDLIYDVPGGNLLLALDGYQYNLPNIALARVAPDEKAMVLCEYTPKMNQAESNYLLRRFSEIYHPTIFTSDTAYVRSASVLQRDDNDRLRDNNYCKTVLRPFLQTDNAQSAVPTRELLNKLKENRVADIIRTSVFSRDARKENRINKECSSSHSKNYGMDFPTSGTKKLFKSLKDEPIWRKGQPDEICDGGSWSTGIALSRSSDLGLEAMSDARYAPIYCQTKFDVMEYGRCNSEWNTFYRSESGQKMCHRFFAQEVTFDEAEAECRKLDAHVSGFNDQDELDFLDRMLDESKKKNVKFPGTVNVWVGAKRRQACTEKGIIGIVGGFSPDPTHPCSRKRVFEWINGVAQNPPDLETRWVAAIEPSFGGDAEQCIQLLKGKQNREHWPKDIIGDKMFNDVPCDSKQYYFCGKEAPTVVINA